MDYKNIQELIKTVSDSKITSFEIDTEGIKIKIDKQDQQGVIERMPVNVKPAEQVNNDALNSGNIVKHDVYDGRIENDIVKTIENQAIAMPLENIFVVKSPIVGTMYSSPGAEYKNFVKVGSEVKIGDTLCILEAMKLMNEIESEVDGVIAEVLVSNEDMVEYAQPLFSIIEN